jgi:hypothetical protein
VHNWWHVPIALDADAVGDDVITSLRALWRPFNASLETGKSMSHAILNATTNNFQRKRYHFENCLSLHRNTARSLDQLSKADGRVSVVDLPTVTY